jgi:hypothetical protein
MKERYFLEQIIVPNAVFVVTIADPPEKLSWPTRRGGTALNTQTSGLQAARDLPRPLAAPRVRVALVPSRARSAS